MKNSKKIQERSNSLILKNTTHFVLALLVAFSFSCSSDDGNDGATGPAGTNGQDGNANVQTYTFDISTENNHSWDISTPQLTQDILDNDVILAYLTRTGSYYPVPGTSYGDEIKISFFPNTTQFIFYDRLSGANITPSAGTYDVFKMIIIESSNTTAGKTNAKQQIVNELNLAGVDMNDHYAVCNYYGIAY